MIKNQNILITGASSGIGQALAVYYAQNGAKHLFLCGRNADRLFETEVACKKYTPHVHTKVIDVTKQDDVKNWILECEETAQINLVIANAGVSTGKETSDSIYQTFNTNIFGVINTVLPAIEVYKKRTEKQLSPGNSSLDKLISGMKKKKKAFFRNPLSKKFLGSIGCELYKSDNKAIAIVSSIAGYHGLPSCPSYSASKACVKAWGAALRENLKPLGINVNVICPGFVKSRITDKNTCPMPFLMEAEKAAEIIAKGIEKNKNIIAFPWPLRFVSWFTSILPERLSCRIYGSLPEKISK